MKQVSQIDVGPKSHNISPVEWIRQGCLLDGDTCSDGSKIGKEHGLRGHAHFIFPSFLEEENNMFISALLSLT